MNLPTVTYLFKEKGINIHGMSVTRRHKLSPLEKNLSNFLYFTELDDTHQNTHLQFIDDIFTNNKIDLNLYRDISKVQQYNLVNRAKIIKEIMSIENNNENINKIEKIKFYLNQKLINLDNNSMSPIVMILILRYYIFDLEKIRNEKEGKHSNLLLLYKNIKSEVEELIKTYENNQIQIIEKLNTKIKNLNLEISSLDNFVKNTQKEVDKNKLINQANKNKRKAAMNKKIKKKLKKENKNQLEKTAKLNIDLNFNKQLLKDKTLLKKDVCDELEKAQYNELKLKKKIETKKNDQEKSNLKINISNEELDY